MVITLTFWVKGSDVPLSLQMERKAAFCWLMKHGSELKNLEVHMGLNLWSWSPTIGWVQFPQRQYVPGKGLQPANIKPKVHGNGYNARHPWRYCMAAECTPNILCLYTAF